MIGFFICGGGVLFADVVDVVLSEKGKEVQTEIVSGQKEGQFVHSLPMRQGDRLLVKGFNGKLTLVGRPQAKSIFLKARRVGSSSEGGDWKFVFQRKGRRVELVVMGPHVRSGWSFGKSFRPQFEFVVVAPFMPAEIHWQEAVIDIKGWKSHLMATLGRGQIKDVNGTNFHKISLQEGSLEVKSHVGRLELESYRGKIRVAHSESSLSVENFSGVSELEKVSGEIYFASYQGVTHVSHSEGKLEFKNIQSPVKINKFKGMIRGKSHQGVVRISSLGRVDIHMTTNEGPVYLKLPQSAAKVDLGSVRGAIYAPLYLNLTRLPHLKVKRGTLKGTKPGSVYVRTQSGQIFLQ